MKKKVKITWGDNGYVAKLYLSKKIVAKYNIFTSFDDLVEWLRDEIEPPSSNRCGLSPDAVAYSIIDPDTGEWTRVDQR